MLEAQAAAASCSCSTSTISSGSTTSTATLAGDQRLLRRCRGVGESAPDGRLLRAHRRRRIRDAASPRTQEARGRGRARNPSEPRQPGARRRRAGPGRRPRSDLPGSPSCATKRTVLRQSDVALYAAKRAGRNGFAWFDEAARARADRPPEARRGHPPRHPKGEFVPFFQPLIDLDSREIVGFEALARWRSPDAASMLEAEHFIEAAERTGLIGPLTLNVMEQAMKEARDWPAHLKLAVNVSPVQFRDPTPRRADPQAARRRPVSPPTGSRSRSPKARCSRTASRC